MSPLTQGLNYRSACDVFTYGVFLSLSISVLVLQTSITRYVFTYDVFLSQSISVLVHQTGVMHYWLEMNASNFVVRMSKFKVTVELKYVENSTLWTETVLDLLG